MDGDFLLQRIDPPAQTPAIPLRTQCHPRRRHDTTSHAANGATCLTSEERQRLQQVTQQQTYARAIQAGASRFACKEPSTAERCVLQRALQVDVHKVFAPDAPRSWSKDPQEWLSDLDVEHVMRQYVDDRPDVQLMPFALSDFGGTEGAVCHNQQMCRFSTAEAEKQGIRHVLLLLNKDVWGGDGTHWVSFYLNVPEGVAFYFDSLGEDLPRHLKHWIQRRRRERKLLHPSAPPLRLERNTAVHQKSGSNCGIYAIHMMVSMIEPTHFARADAPDDLYDKIRYFQTAKELSNEYMQKLRYYYFNVMPRTPGSRKRMPPKPGTRRNPVH
jgi:hypothetical protein